MLFSYTHVITKQCLNYTSKTIAMLSYLNSKTQKSLTVLQHVYLQIVHKV